VTGFSNPQVAVGRQRDWRWRGWQIRYLYQPAQTPAHHPPLLLLHGFGASLEHWRYNLPALSQNHRVYALDLLGFGASEKAHAHYNAAFWVEQVYEFWRIFIGKPVVLVGNSIGSLVCLAAAAKHPEMVAGLVFLNLPDASVLDSPAPMRALLGAIAHLTTPMLNLTKAIFTTPPLFNPFFHLIRQPPLIRWWAKQAYSNPAVVDDHLVQILSRPAGDRGAARALRAMVNARPTFLIDYTAKTLLPQLTLPMLMIWGKQDRMVPPVLAPRFVKYNPQLTLVILDNAGHCPHDECPEEVNRLILDWLAGLESTVDPETLAASGVS